MKNLIFNITLATLFTHELDAVANHEWRVLPLTSWLPEQYGITAFIFFHIPLFAVVIALASSKDLTIRFRTKIGISLFMIIHGMLHLAFIANPNYEFSSLLSSLLIFGGALLAAFHLFLEYFEKKKNIT